MENHDYASLVSTLPKPITPEEQYLYSLVCSAAGVAHQTPFKSPFWRLEQYWKAFYEVMSDRYTYIVPSDDTVGTSAIKDSSVTEDKLANVVKEKLLSENSVKTEYIDNMAVTQDKLSTDVRNQLLLPKSVSVDKLTDEVENRLLSENRITEAMLVQELAAKLLGNSRVTKDMLSDEVQAILDKVK